MSLHKAHIRWQAEGDFAQGAYSRAHVWEFDGGLCVPASASPLVVPLPYSVSEAVDPEEAFVAALSSCHMLWFLDLARQAGFVLASYCDMAEAEMGKSGGEGAITRVTLRPQAVWLSGAKGIPSPAQETDLHKRAHRKCFIANSVKTEIVIAPDFLR